MNRISEYGQWFEVSDRNALSAYLQKVWVQQCGKSEPDEQPEGFQDSRFQGFLSFDGNRARARNFIGFIQGDGEHIEIYPKVFKDSGVASDSILKHMFFWFDYCRKWKFPCTDVNLDTLQDVQLPELMINLIASQLLDTVSTSPLSLYEEVAESLLVPKGKINFGRYIDNNFSKGNFQYLECDYEPLVFDNKLNRAIKYVARLLSHKAKFSETHRKLDELVFLLHEVEDCPCTAQSLEGISLNAFFVDYHNVISLCKMVIESQVYGNNYDTRSHWSMLLPMEYVFEDFMAGFLEKHLSADWEVKYQKSEMNLTDQSAFRMQHDIFLTSKRFPSRQIIVDTKYKLRGDFKPDNKRGISQSDMYQMASYALRRGCTEVLLLYPNQSDQLLAEDHFTISSGFNVDHKINITAAEIPFWSSITHLEISKKLHSRLEELLVPKEPYFSPAI